MSDKTTIPQPTAVQEIAQLADRARTAREVIHRTETDGTPFTIGPDGQPVSLATFEPDSPRRLTTRATLFDAASFIAYVNRYKDSRSVIAVDTRNLDAVKFEATLDYHHGSSKEEVPLPEWCSHKAGFALTATPDWKNWVAVHRKPMTLESFAEFVQENSRTFSTPDAASMAELAAKFEAKKDSTFKQGVTLESGDRMLEFQEATTATAGKMPVPKYLEIAVKPFLGATAETFGVFFRFSVRDGKLSITLVLDRPDIKIDIAAEAIVERITTETAVPIFAGAL